MKTGAIKLSNDNHEWYIIDWIDRKLKPGYQMFHPPGCSFYFVGESDLFEESANPNGYYTVYEIVEKNCEVFIGKTNSFIKL